MSQAATMVFPKAVVAARTPVSCRSKSSAANCCSGRSTPMKETLSALPPNRSSWRSGWILRTLSVSINSSRQPRGRAKCFG